VSKPEPYAFDERILAERLASIINPRLQELSRTYDQLRQEVNLLKANLEVTRRETIQSLSEALVRANVAELAKAYIVPEVQRLESRNARLEANLAEVARRLDALINILQTSAPPVKEEAPGEAGERLFEEPIDARLDAIATSISAMKDMVADIPELESRLAALERKVGELAQTLSSLAPIIQSLAQGQEELSKAVKEIAESLGEVRGAVEEIHEVATSRARVEEEEEERPQPETRRAGRR